MGSQFFSSLPIQILDNYNMIKTVKMESDKFRLSCSLYELIEIWAMRKAEVEILYNDSENKEQRIDGIITNVYSRDGLEQVVINEDLIIPTKSLIRINDVSFSNYMG